MRFFVPSFILDLHARGIFPKQSRKMTAGDMVSQQGWTKGGKVNWKKEEKPILTQEILSLSCLLLI